jgi:hypothetical protein
VPRARVARRRRRPASTRAPPPPCSSVRASSGQPHLLDLSSAEPETIARSYLCGEGRAGGSWTGRVEASRALRMEGWHVSALALGRTSHEPVSRVGRTEPRRSLASSLVNSPRSDVLPQLFLTSRGSRLLALRRRGRCRRRPGRRRCRRQSSGLAPLPPVLLRLLLGGAPPPPPVHAEVLRGPTTRGALVRLAPDPAAHGLRDAL